MKSLYFIVILFLYLSSNTVAKESRIFLEGYINGKPVKLILDTGATGPTLFRPAVKRLKLSIERPPANVKVEKGLVRYALTEKCKFQMVEGGTESTLNFAVIDVPDFLTRDIDGAMGWGGFGHMMIELNSNLRKVKIRNKLEFDKSEWKCLDIRKDINVLVVNTSSKDKTRDCFLIDTGSPDGLTVGGELWDKLVGGEITNKTTLSASYMPGVGLTVNKENWLEKIDLGGLQLCDIPVKRGMDSLKVYTDLGVDGILGMWALSCYSWILDGENGKVYYKKNELVRIPEKYEYNRLGAVFVPEDIRTSNSLLAHVVKDGPAYKAGIRDGDELLKIGRLDVTKWRTDRNVLPLGRFWSNPAGTKVELLLKQNGKIKELSVTLKEIFKNDTVMTTKDPKKINS